MERVARELGFNTPGREVERMFKQQEEEFFFPGPNQQEHEWAEAWTEAVLKKNPSIRLEGHGNVKKGYCKIT